MWLANFANDASSMVHLRSSPWHIPCQPYGRLSIVVHYPLVSLRAAQSGLQSAPACRMRWVNHHLLKSYDRNLSKYSQYRTSFCLRTHFHTAKVRKNIEKNECFHMFIVIILLAISKLQYTKEAHRLSRFLYLMLFRQIPLIMADRVLYGILHFLLFGSKRGNSKVPLSSRFWYKRKPSLSHLSIFTCWRFLEKNMKTAPPRGGSSISDFTILYKPFMPKFMRT